MNSRAPPLRPAYVEVKKKVESIKMMKKIIIVSAMMMMMVKRKN
jgi:hypothetical protein